MICQLVTIHVKYFLFIVLNLSCYLNSIVIVEARTFNLPPVDYSLADAVKSDVTYQLFKNLSTEGIYINEESIKNISINKNIPTKIFIHGWLSNETTYWYHPLRDEYFKKGDHNIIFIDWSKAGSKAYDVSAANSKPIGHFIGDLIMASDIKYKNVHVIGHSLGSHVAGFVGKRIRGTSGKKVGRITGTDPAGPKFEHEDVGENERIAKSDAEFVDIIHTDGGYYGFTEAIGLLDFYANGGSLQPGCPSHEEDDNCSHARSNWYFIESVNSYNFKARKCTSWDDYVNSKCDHEEAITFGENVFQNATGTYYFATNSESPFAKG